MSVRQSMQKEPLPVWGVCLPVCNQSVYADNCSDAVDRLLIRIYLFAYLSISKPALRFHQSDNLEFTKVNLDEFINASVDLFCRTPSTTILLSTDSTKKMKVNHTFISVKIVVLYIGVGRSARLGGMTTI